MHKRFTLFLFFFCIMSDAVSDTIFKCADDNGKISYSQIPCPELNKKLVDTMESSEYPPPAHIENKHPRQPASPVDSPDQSPRIVTIKRDDSSAKETACREYKKRIESIDATMREGYTEPTGESLRESRRQAESAIFELKCNGF